MTSSCDHEHIIYRVDLLSNNVEKGLKLLIDAILNVDLVLEEMEGIKISMRIQVFGSIKKLRQQMKLVKLSFEELVKWMRSAVQVLIKKLAKSAKPEFFSLSTSALMQMAFDMCRDDAQANFLSYYAKYSVLDKDRLETLDQESVGDQVRLVVKLGRGTRRKIELGFCGENSGKP
ncbi:hypothetical protein JG688_00017845 [Phytophthora aleatoria]|uniref:Uncharacterized protein n=1 Tax=Phytophthora aleatoria TaxID=2496075 RepID=A0A8J5I0B0_9STRA|nr:hypothetical protein JG688_00017845 [Phytophthora aleatoria]